MDWKALDALIDKFEVMLKTGQSLENPLPDWKAAIWEKAAQIQADFRSVHYPRREDRERAWDRFTGLRQQGSAQHQRERDERRWQSESHSVTILHQVEAARPRSLLGIDSPDIAEMKNLGQTTLVQITVENE